MECEFDAGASGNVFEGVTNNGGEVTTTQMKFNYSLMENISQFSGFNSKLDEGKASVTVNQTTPSKYKYGAHMWLITHAKKVCKSRSPGCDTCVIDKVCDKRMIDIPKSKLRDTIKNNAA